MILFTKYTKRMIYFHWLVAPFTLIYSVPCAKPSSEDLRTTPGKWLEEGTRGSVTGRSLSLSHQPPGRSNRISRSNDSQTSMLRHYLFSQNVERICSFYEKEGMKISIKWHNKSFQEIVNLEAMRETRLHMTHNSTPGGRSEQMNGKE